MAARFSLKLDKGWDKYARGIDAKRFRRNLQKAKRRALRAIAKKIVSEVIDAGVPPENAPLTVSIKGKNSPLDDRGAMKRAITTKIVNKDTLKIFIPTTAKNYKGYLSAHDGATIKVTAAMRQMFFALWLVSIGANDPQALTGRAKELFKRKPDGWKPLREATKAIKIPRRPYFEVAFGSAAVRAKAIQEFEKAVTDALRKSIK